MVKWFTPSKIIFIGFLSLGLIGGILLTLPIASPEGKECSFVDGLFTAVSSVCVTGLNIKDTPNDFTTFGHIVMLLLIQIGGIGYMSIAALLFFLLRRRFSVRQTTLTEESIGYSSGEIQKFMVKLIKITVTFELIGAVILSICFAVKGIPGAIFKGIFHSVSAFCNAGFSLFSDNLCSFVNSPVVILTIGLLIIFGGLGFVVWKDIRENILHKKRLDLNAKLVIVTTLLLLGIGIIGVLAFEWSGTLGAFPVKTKILASFFQSVTPRTAGFQVVNVGNYQSATLLLTIILMFIGASPGGTGGGIKTTSAAIIWLCLIAFMKKKRDIVCFNRKMGHVNIEKVYAVTFTAILVVLAGIMILTLSEKGQSFVALVFEEVSAFGTVGLSMGSKINPYCSLAYDFTNIGKIVLIITMLIGRVGPIIVGTLFLPLPEREIIKYPKDEVLVG
ncbi:MAG: TrkH family potassium uptake protein [bacterium]|nr:TrkH family potassium uptake protein [bacterium]